MPSRLFHRTSLFVAMFMGSLLVPMTAAAQVVGGGALPIDKTYETISAYTLMIAQFLNIMTWFVFSFLIFLLDPAFIFDEGGTLMDVLNLIWRLSRDLMNVAFAVGLIGAAIYTVVTANKEFISSNLKTFVLAVVLVNFSWFVPRVVLDIANIATATIYSIPSAIPAADVQCTYTSTKPDGCIPAAVGGAALPPGTKLCKCKAVADFKPFPTSETIKLIDGDPKDPLAWHCIWAYCIRFIELDAATSTAHGGVLNGLIVNHARLPQLAVVTRTDVDDDIADLLLFILRELVVIAIHVAMFFPLLALLVALVIRIPILWLTIAFMPFYFLSRIIPGGLGFVEEAKNKAAEIWTMFLKAAFLPAAVAVPLTIGFIMSNAASRVTFAGIEDIPFNLIDGMGSFGQLLWVVMVIGILWSGTFMVLKLMTADMPGGGLIDSIKSTGEEAGKFAAELPLSTVPLPGVGGNLLNMTKMFGPQGINMARHTIQRGGPLALFGNDDSKDSDRVKSKAERMKKDDKAQEKFTKALEEFGKNPEKLKIDDVQLIFQEQFKDTGVKLTDANFKEHITLMMKTIGVNEAKIAEFQKKADAYLKVKPGAAPAPGAAPGGAPAPGAAPGGAPGGP